SAAEYTKDRSLVVEFVEAAPNEQQSGHLLFGVDLSYVKRVSICRQRNVAKLFRIALQCFFHLQDSNGSARFGRGHNCNELADHYAFTLHRSFYSQHLYIHGFDITTVDVLSEAVVRRQ